MAGFMMQKGRIIVCGDAGDALADSMYEGTVFVGGDIAALGNDAVIDASRAKLGGDLGPLLAQLRRPGVRPPFTKVVVGPQAVELRQEGNGDMEGGFVTPEPARLRLPRASRSRLCSQRHLHPGIIEDIQAKAELGRYRIRGFGTLRPRTWATFDDLTFVPCGLTRIPLEGYREQCSTQDRPGHPLRRRSRSSWTSRS